MKQYPTTWSYYVPTFKQKLAIINEILMPIDGIKAKNFGFGFGAVKTNQRINKELERRGIDYRISSCFLSPAFHILTAPLLPIGIHFIVAVMQADKAMSLICADINARGC